VVQTISKSLTIVRETSSPLLGYFQGYNTDNPTDTFTVILQRNPYYLFVKNLPKGCNGYINPSEGIEEYGFGVVAASGFRGIKFGDISPWRCGKIQARGYLTGYDTLTINYKHWPRVNPADSNDYKHDTIPRLKQFKGVRRY
jgi:hypothetical protein